MAAFAFKFNIRFRLDKFRNALAEFAFDILERDLRIFYGVVQGRSGQKFLVVCHGGGNGDGFHRVDDIRETLPLAFRSLVCLDRKNNRFVEN